MAASVCAAAGGEDVLTSFVTTFLEPLHEGLVSGSLQVDTDGNLEVHDVPCTDEPALFLQHLQSVAPWILEVPEMVTNLTNAGGPAGPAEQWALLCTSRGVHSHDLKKGLLQLFDGPAPEGGGSSTFTYLLWDAPTKEALLIDPVARAVVAGCRPPPRPRAVSSDSSATNFGYTGFYSYNYYLTTYSKCLIT